MVKIKTKVLTLLAIQRPDGGSGGNFDFPYDKNAPDPHSYRDASIAQLYYTTNMVRPLLPSPLSLPPLLPLPKMNPISWKHVTDWMWMQFHDLLEELGFDEAAGNFEDADDKPCGKGNDAVQVNAQDGGGRNNANFGTPPDGERPRMVCLFCPLCMYSLIVLTATTTTETAC